MVTASEELRRGQSWPRDLFELGIFLADVPFPARFLGNHDPAGMPRSHLTWEK